MTHICRTRRLGDSIHAYAVMLARAEQGGEPLFRAYTPFAELFAGGPLRVQADHRGSQWQAASREAFRGPQHDVHVRDSMAQAAGLASVAAAELQVRGGPVHDQPYLVVCPDAGVRYKEWRPERWGALIEQLLHGGFQVIICGMPGRRKIPAPAQARHVDLAIIPLAGALARAQALIGPDSGPVHLADALGTPAIGLYAATSTITYGPYRDSRWCVDRYPAECLAGAAHDTARHVLGHAMDAIEVDDVVRALTQALVRSER